MTSLIYIIFAALGLGLLIFIHELGHYFMAKRVGMKVEAFGIGFGKPIYSWERNGVSWRLCWIPFGGYVKIAGMETEEGKDPYDIPNGYFSKKPIDRIKVALAGPLVNIIFAFLVFALLWLFGGREKNFAEYSSVIGWVDPMSELYANGVRPGDIITGYDDQAFTSYKDHLYMPMTASETLDVKGYKVNYLTNEKEPFSYNVKVYPHPSALLGDLKTAGILNSAGYIIYDKMANGAENPLPEGSPLKESGIGYGDRIVWVDGEVIYSDQELSNVLNEKKALLTIHRGNETLIRRAPRVLTEELKLDTFVKDELIDWQYAAQLSGTKFNSLYMIPYNLNSDCVVENPLRLIDGDRQEELFSKNQFSELDSPLVKGDKIIAIDGMPVQHAYQLLNQVQKDYVNIIVERNFDTKKLVSSNESSEIFNQEFSWKDLAQIASTIGTEKTITDQGNLHLLKPVIPKTRAEFALSPEAQAHFAADLLEKRKELEAIQDPDKKAYALKLLNQREKQLVLGIPYQDRKVNYNPSPAELFVNVLQEIWHTLTALVMGNLNPKWISGPLGIVQVVHDSWMVGMQEALFWIGAISLNLGILNLLPIPVLDGGYITLSLFEMATHKRLKPKTLEKLIIPFAVLLIGFLIFLTYNDLLRLIG